MIVGRFRHLFHIYLFVCGKKLGYFSFIVVTTDLYPHIKFPVYLPYFVYRMGGS